MGTCTHDLIGELGLQARRPAPDALKGNRIPRKSFGRETSPTNGQRKFGRLASSGAQRPSTANPREAITVDET